MREGTGMLTMKAIVRRRDGVALRDVPVPEPRHGEVRVRVRMVGVCRTDVHAARGLVPCAEPVILSHEAAGTIHALGPGVERLRLGDRVAVLPVFGCEACVVCQRGDAINCPRRGMLGLDLDGAFAEYVCVPARNVYPVPEHVGWEEAAYAEPVAAARAILRIP